MNTHTHTHLPIYPAWVLLGLGVYSLAAGLGEFRSPGFWMQMVDEASRSAALRFFTGLFCLALGMAFYLIGPWDFADWMLVVVKLIGGWMVIEGALILAFGDVFMKFARRLMGTASRLWAGLSALIGIGLIIAAALRI